MDKIQLIRQRHSVRQYQNKPIEAEKIAVLESEIESINTKNGLHIQLFINEPEVFCANDTHYGNFKNCRNYFAMVAPKGYDEKIGYFGEQLVIKAQELGLNTCWVAMSYKKGKVSICAEKGEKLYLVIALGYGENQGIAHRSRNIFDIADVGEYSPQWFKNGIEAVLLAPSAMNQQRFFFYLVDDKYVKAMAKIALYRKIDLGIAKYHFEIGAGKENFLWK